MIHTTDVEARGLRFRVDVAGPERGEPVLMLHGFPQSRHTWRHQLEALGAEGYRVIAPDQRGYSPGARPEGVVAYATDELIADALAIARAMGTERFHLVGHDWGGPIAWLLAAHRPGCVASLTVLSRPHPAAFAHAMRADPEQGERARHHRAFQQPDAAARLRREDALRRTLLAQGVAAEDAETYLAPLEDEAALDAALNWYRAAARADSGRRAETMAPVHAPVLYVWGDADASVGRVAAEATPAYLRRCRFEVLADVGHFVTDDAGERVTRLLREHLAEHRMESYRRARR